MAEALGVVGSVRVVLQITRSNLKYLIAVRDAHSDQKRLLEGISSFRGFLETLQLKAADLNEGDPLLITFQILTAPLKQIEEVLENLSKALEPLAGPKRLGPSNSMAL